MENQGAGKFVIWIRDAQSKQTLFEISFYNQCWASRGTVIWLWTRVSHCAQSAGEISRIPPSKLAVMFSAKSASKNVWHPAHGNVPTAISLLGAMTTCISHSNRSKGMTYFSSSICLCTIHHSCPHFLSSQPLFFRRCIRLIHFSRILECALFKLLEASISHMSRPWKETAFNLPMGVFVYIDDFLLIDLLHMEWWVSRGCSGPLFCFHWLSRGCCSWIFFSL